MTLGSKKHIFVVDDDKCILDIVSLILKRARYECTCFLDADDCLRQLHTGQCDLLISDVKMPGKNGIELLIHVKRFAPWLPVIMISCYADIQMAVQAVKAGAFDFIEKPADSQKLLAVVKSALKQHAPHRFLHGKSLTGTEKMILNLILHGKSNKEMARILHRSIRTIEYHRNHIMHKFGVDNLVDLVKRALAKVPERKNLPKAGRK
ncbi:MAG: response regulator transcription factor [Planctomycetota bacterium]|jgi:FixJ family two-component response regulator